MKKELLTNATTEQLFELLEAQSKTIAKVKSELIDDLDRDIGHFLGVPWWEKVRKTIEGGFQEIEKDQLYRMRQISKANTPNAPRVVVFYREVSFPRYILVLYELFERGSGISTLELHDGSQLLDALMNDIQSSLNIAINDYALLDYADPVDWDGERMDHQLIINPSETDDF